jgi:hypothetical protein
MRPEGMLNCFKHHLLVVGMLDLFRPNNLLFVQHFDGVKAEIVFAPN